MQPMQLLYLILLSWLESGIEPCTGVHTRYIVEVVVIIIIVIVIEIFFKWRFPIMSQKRSINLKIALTDMRLKFAGCVCMHQFLQFRDFNKPWLSFIYSSEEFNYLFVSKYWKFGELRKRCRFVDELLIVYDSFWWLIVYETSTNQIVAFASENE